MIGKLISGVVGILGATLLFWIGIAFEHRPAGWPNIPLNVGPIHWAFHLPDGPYARLDRQAGDLATAGKNEQMLTAALNAQSAAVRQISAQGRVALAKAETATSAYRVAAVKASKTADSLMALGEPTPETPDACKRAEAVRAAFTRSLP